MVNLIIGFLLLLSFSHAASEGASSTLGEALSQKKKTFTQKMPKEVSALYEANIKELKESGLDKQSLKVGDKAPEVQVNLGGEKHPLSHIYAAGPVVIKFYRGGWCPYCMTELKHYQAMFPEFKKAGAQILAIAPDTAAEITKTRTTHALSYDVVSDEGHAIAKKFGLVYKLDQKVVDQLKKNGIDLSIYQGNNNNELAIPGTFVVGKDGKIAFAYVDADYRVRAEPAQVLKVVKALK